MPSHERSDLLNMFNQQMDELLKLVLTLDGKAAPGDRDYLPPVDVYETADQYVVEIELPGFDKEDLSLRLCCNVLVVEGTKREEERKNNVAFICLERKFGRFIRLVELPPTIDTSGVSARYVRGLLRVTFPRIADARTMVRDIPIE